MSCGTSYMDGWTSECNSGDGGMDLSGGSGEGDGGKIDDIG